MKKNRTALLHYWLTNWRGGENVFAEISNMFPDADIFTHAYNPSVMGDVFKKHCIKETFIGKFPGAKKNCQQYLPLMPLALKKLNFSGYDLIISSESGPVKGIRKPDGCRHICYCHTPMRYIWDMYDDYFRSAGLAGKISMLCFRDYMRRYDLRSADSVDQFIANSHFVAERIRRIYRRDAEIIYPPVETAYFSALSQPRQDYYLLAGQLVAYKHPELAILACTQLRKKLIVIGSGPLQKQLQKIAGPTIEFRGHVSNAELRCAYAGARALIFPGIEDFGIVPVEAQSAGTCVIAFGAGGALETVLPEKTGVFFDSPTVKSLTDAIRRFETLSFSSCACRENALRFAPEVFRKRFAATVNRF